MGERKGTNHYYPPDYDPRKGSLNSFLGTHALRERACKIHMGILIIRFEMPYNIWCDGCKNHIGMGVRYNAEKKKIGMYYTTPVYQFRMKCHLCDNHFEIKTDPGNLDYVIVSGARRQENRWDPTQNEQVVPEDKDTQKRLFDDPMYKLEHGSKDESTAKRVAPVLGRLMNRNEEAWKDDFSANAALRSKFRAKKKEMIKQEQKDALLLQKSSLSINLLPENEDDIKLASLLALAPSKTMIENQEMARDNIMNRPALPSCTGTSPGFLGLQNAKRLEEQHKLRKKIGGIVRSKVKLRKSTPSVLSSEDSIASDISSPCCSSVSSESPLRVASPLPIEMSTCPQPLTDENDDEETAQKKCRVEVTVQESLPKRGVESESKSSSISLLSSGSLVSGDYGSSESDDG
ncbi:Coiled-coil domain-containing protein 130-like protein [Frankliniella fusca]|uniref:Coiled-coil domain-containing protein 130-like protein n=1 Tax=Frankliniella fusca TaxID=407009 RepID=A0AAE1HNK7_9NEOP|nr:Coiled-coil domain-containing protein 130-like protein [Frankliniella fusca]